MLPFLQLVANDLYARIGDDLSRTIVIFPNKRAGLFLDDFLLPQPGKPIWSPKYMTISEFFHSLTSTKTADPIETICRLYKHYVHFTKSQDSLDYFYGWGERLLADFDDLDKQLAPAQKVFQNLQAFEELGGKEEILTEEQIEQLNRFLSDFKEENRTFIRERFLQLWESILLIYNALREELSSIGLAYEGQLFREVAEGLQAGSITLPENVDHVAVVGLNVLSEAERALFKALQKQGKAIFYWDYDTYYVSPEGKDSFEAGTFMQRNLKDFPNALKVELFGNFLKDRESDKRTIEFVSSTSETAQAQNVADWLGDPRNFQPEVPRETAIVLCNESLLQPVLHSLPEKVNEVNITKGFPLSHTPAYAFVLQQLETTPNISLNDLQTRVAEEAKRMLALAKENEFFQILYTESFFLVHSTIGRFLRLKENDFLQVQAYTLIRLLRQTLQTITVPFHGEPATGLQVMGVLETRCLDFKRVYMISVSEGVLPQKSTEASFIPFLIRHHFGLTTSLHKTAVYAYYFHRLIQRAERVRLSYNVSSDGTQKGEMSRFMKALLVDKRLNIKRFMLSATAQPFTIALEQAPKPTDFAEKVMAEVSPSKLNMYMRCQLSFYFRYVLGIREPDEDNVTISFRHFGTLLHRSAELFYKEFGQDGEKTITPKLLGDFLKSSNHEATLRKHVRQAFIDEDINYTHLAEEATIKYMNQLLRFEAGMVEGQLLPARNFKVFKTEKETFLDIHVPYGVEGKVAKVKLKGFCDRMDKAELPDGTYCIRIVDYKTGGNPETLKSMEQLFIAGANHPHYTLQTFIYALTAAKDSLLPVIPAVYYVNHMAEPDFSPYIKISKEPMLDFREISSNFKKGLIQLIGEILDPRTDFLPTKESGNCKTCFYVSFCGKQA